MRRHLRHRIARLHDRLQALLGPQIWMYSPRTGPGSVQYGVANRHEKHGYNFIAALAGAAIIVMLLREIYQEDPDEWKV